MRIAANIVAAAGLMLAVTGASSVSAQQHHRVVRHTVVTKHVVKKRVQHCRTEYRHHRKVRVCR